MKLKNTALLAVLAGGMVAAAYFYSQREEVMLTEAAIPTRTIETGVTSGTIERMEIAAPGQPTVKLTTKDGQWYSDADKGHLADKAAIQQAITVLEPEIKGDVVSTEKSSHANYMVDDAGGTRVKVFKSGSSAPALDLIVGKEGSDAFTTFVRKPDSDEVLSVRAMLSMAFRKPAGWRNLQIFEMQADNATRIEATGTSATYTLAKSGEKWNLEVPALGEAQTHQVSSIVSLISSLKAPRYADTTAPLSELGLDPPKEKIAVQFRDESTTPAKTNLATLLIGRLDDSSGDYYAKSATNDSVFFVGENVVRAVSPEISRLAVTPPVEAGTTATETAVETTTTPSADEEVSTVTQAILENTTPAEVMRETVKASASESLLAFPPATQTTETKVEDEKSQVPAEQTTATVPGL